MDFKAVLYSITLQNRNYIKKRLCWVGCEMEQNDRPNITKKGYDVPDTSLGNVRDRSCIWYMIPFLFGRWHTVLLSIRNLLLLSKCA